MVNLFGKQYSWTGAGIFAAVVLVIAYYLGTRTGKGKVIAATDEALQKELQNDGLSYEPSQYESYAQKLYIAMYDIMDDEETIYSVISKMRNKSDLLQLIKTFGERGGILQLGAKTLNQWINFKLDETEIAKINEILARNSIQYEF